MSKHIDVREGFCPRCFDFHKFELREDDYPTGVVGAFCMKCGFACFPEDVPHDAEKAEEQFPEEI